MNSASTHATVLMSGGIDSAACIHLLQSRGIAVDAIFINFGQAAAMREVTAATAMADYLGISLLRADLSATSTSGPGELIGRNAFLIFTALFLRKGRPGLLGLGVHAGTPYYDCSEPFLTDTGRLIAEHTDGRVSLIAPFATWTKKDVFHYFVSAGLPVEVTYSCEAGTAPVCGSCASCRDRAALGC